MSCFNAMLSLELKISDKRKSHIPNGSWPYPELWSCPIQYRSPYSSTPVKLHDLLCWFSFQLSESVFHSHLASGTTPQKSSIKDLRKANSGPSNHGFESNDGDILSRGINIRLENLWSFASERESSKSFVTRCYFYDRTEIPVEVSA